MILDIAFIQNINLLQDSNNAFFKLCKPIVAFNQCKENNLEIIQLYNNLMDLVVNCYKNYLDKPTSSKPIFRFCKNFVDNNLKEKTQTTCFLFFVGNELPPKIFHVIMKKNFLIS